MFDATQTVLERELQRGELQSSGGRGRTDERVEVLGVTSVQWARQDAGDDAAEDLAKDIDPDLVPVAVEDDGRAQGTRWADGTARECSGCIHHTALSQGTGAIKQFRGSSVKGRGGISRHAAAAHHGAASKLTP